MSAAAVAHAAQQPASIFPTATQIAAAGKLPGWGGFQSACGNVLQLRPVPMGDFSPGGHYDAHGETAAGDTTKAQRSESFAVFNLSVCYQISHEKKYAAKAEGLLDSIASTTTRIGSDQGEDEFNFFFPYALMGAYALKSDPAWNSAGLATFVRRMVVPASHDKHDNNHANWGVLLDATAAAFLGDDALLHAARNRWLELMRAQVAADGSLPLEICRSNTTDWCGGPAKGIKGISYTHWTLLPTTLAAEIFRNLGMDVYNTPEGALLQKAYHRAAVWTAHPETFPYYAANGGKLEGVKNAAYFYILQTVYPDPEAAALLHTPGAVLGDELHLRLLYGGAE